MTSSSDNITSTELLVDRFISASSANDAKDGLNALVDDALAQNDALNVLQNPDYSNELMEALLQVLSSFTYKNLPLEEEGATLVLRLYIACCSSTTNIKFLLEQPQEGRLLTTLLDVVETSVEEENEHQTLHYSSYTKVLALQLLVLLARKSPTLTQTQLLSIPHGLHKLGNLLLLGDDDAVQQEALALGAVIGSWPSCAKVWIFEGVVDQLLSQYILSPNSNSGGLTGGSILVRDGLDLIHTLLKHDASCADLIWQSPTFAPNICRLLDLRQGLEFQDPTRIQQRKQTTKKKKQQTLKATTVAAMEEDDDDEDDLDAILASGGGIKKSPKKSTSVTASPSQQVDDDDDDRLIPYLLPDEEDVIHKVLLILEALLALESTRKMVWRQHAPLLGAVWENGLIVPKLAPDAKPFCAMPSSELQQAILEHVAQYMNDPNMMKQLYGLDRCLYLACAPISVPMLSQAALAVIRATLPQEDRNAMVIQALAPTPDDDDDPSNMQPENVILKLLNTAMEQLSSNNDDDNTNNLLLNTMTLSGALGALELFLLDETTREMMIKITDPLMETILITLEQSQQQDPSVASILLKFLCVWCNSCPPVVVKLFSSPHSTVLPKYMTRKDKSSSTDATTTTTTTKGLACLLLGLTLEYLPSEDTSAGGWNKETILQIITSAVGMSTYLKQLEAVILQQTSTTTTVWKSLEYTTFREWYQSQVLVVRRCIVREMAGGVSGDDDDDDETDTEDDATTTGGGSTSSSSKALKKLVAQQSQELESLRNDMMTMQQDKISLESELSTWKRRVVEAPSQVDEMLSELIQTKNELEGKVTYQQVEFKTKQTSLQSLLEQERDSNITLKESLRTSQETYTTLEQERDSLQYELKALSSAYSNLEQDFHNSITTTQSSSTTVNATTESATTTGDYSTLQAENEKLKSDARAADDWMRMAVQRMNDMGEQIATLEQQVATSSAMTTTSGDGSSKSHELQQALEEERQQRRIVELQVEQERQRRSSLELQLESVAKKSSDDASIMDAAILQQELEEERSKSIQLQTELDNAKQDVTSTLNELGTSKSEQERLEQEILNLKTDLTVAHAEVTSFKVEQREREESTSSGGEMSAEAQVVALRETVASLQEQLASSTTTTSTDRGIILDMDTTNTNTVQNLTQELQQRDYIITDLQAKLTAMESSKDVAILKDEEITRLKKSNFEAQEWMTKAVAHNEVVTAQLKALESDKASLIAEMDELRNNNSSTAAADSQQEEEEEAPPPIDRLVELETDLVEARAELEDAQEEVEELRQQLEAATASAAPTPALPSAADNEAITKLEKELEKRDQQVDLLHAEVVSLKALQSAAQFASQQQSLQQKEDESSREQIATLQAELEASFSAAADLRQQAATAGALEKLLEEARDRNTRLETQVSTVQDENSIVVEEIKALRMEMKDRDDELLALTNEIAQVKQVSTTEIQALHAQVADYTQMTSNLERKSAEAEALRMEASDLRDALVMAQSDYDRLKMELNHARNESSASMNERTSAFEQIQNEVVALRASQSTLEQSCEAYKASVEKMKGEVSSLQTTKASLEEALDLKSQECTVVQSQLAELQTWSTAAQQRIAELESSTEAANQVSTLRHQEEVALRESTETELKNTIEQLNIEVEKLKHDIVKQSSSSAQTTAEMERHLADRDVTIATLEQSLADAHVQVSTVQSEGLEVVSQWEERVKDLKATIAEQEASLESQQDEAANVINEWSSRCAELDETIAQLEAEKNAVQSDGLEVVSKWEGRVKELEATIAEQESSLESQQEEASNVIREWNTRCTELDETIAQLEMEKTNLQEEKETLEKTLEQAQNSSTVETDRLSKEVEDLVERFTETEEMHAEQKEVLETQVDAATNKVRELETMLGSSNAEKEELAMQLSDANTKISNQSVEYEERIAALQEQVESTNTSLQESTLAIENSEKLVQELETKVTGLQSELAQAEEQREKDQTDAASQLEDLKSQLEEATSLQDTAAEAVEEMKKQMVDVTQDSENVIGQWQSRVDALEETIADMEEQLESTQTEATEAITAWEGNCAEMEEKNAELENELDEMSTRLVQALLASVGDAEKILVESSSGEYEPKSDNIDLEVTEEKPISSLVEELQTLQTEATTLLASTVSDLLAKRTSLEEDLSAMKENIAKLETEMETKTASAEESLSKEKENSAFLKESLEQVEKELEERKSISSKELDEARERITCLESEVEKATNETLSKVEELSKESDGHAEAKSRVDELQKRLKALKDEMEELEKTNISAEAKLSKERKEWTVKLEKERSDSVDEQVRLRDHIAQLEEDLLAANDALQAQVTERVTERASEVATKALQAELLDMRTQIEGDREAVQTERRARQLAEQEVERVKAEMATLLEVDGDAGVDERVKSMTMKASQKVQRKERIEIQELRSALQRTTKSLEESQASETDLRESLSVSRQQLAVAEQDIIVAKSELNFVTHALDEAKENDMSRCAAFEYRIGSLEDDRESMRRTHTDEIETLRNELSQITMEKDRVLQSLKESEKANTALLYSTRKEHSREPTGTPEAELARLRISHAQLLAAAAEEGARTERRIREAVEANTKSNDTEVMVERELRIASEAALENLRHQLQVYQEGGIASSPNRIASAEASAKLSGQLSRSRAEARKLSEENSSLRFELEQTKADMETTVAELEEKWKTAQAKAKRMERQGLHQANVTLETARMHQKRAREEMPEGSEGWISVHVQQPAPGTQQEEKKEGFTAAAEAYDYIQQQQEAIHEERRLYQELLSEHDDLLALLAQQDLEKASLTAALVNAAGTEAVDSAIQEAEENAIRQFGKFVRLT